MESQKNHVPNRQADSRTRKKHLLIPTLRLKTCIGCRWTTDALVCEQDALHLNTEVTYHDLPCQGRVGGHLQDLFTPDTRPGKHTKSDG